MQLPLMYPKAVLPQNYRSLVAPEEKIAYAHGLVDLARERGLTPVAASLVGSTLRGQDTEDSDMDGLVLVLDNIKSTTWADDVQVHPLDKYLSLLSKSVPFMEFLRSPFMVVDPRYRAFLASQRVNPYEFQVHAERFVMHSWRRARKNDEKRYRHAFAAWTLLTTGAPLVPREYMNPDNAPEQFWDWLNNAVYHER